ncbi:hypothetical protein [Nocardioides sp. Kera G14]|uniref:hypothetical protein n=1 Tax=Nocardioides sp. Kera G14 TaxID=2884264 RepID=UPI001D121AB3|nr:hypothetical protein [Nocardioides sp. Kera G14]UDY22346.1 hypothetical protein LH076_09655 [Nocardioides sp. Kera G14]
MTIVLAVLAAVALVATVAVAITALLLRRRVAALSTTVLGLQEEVAARAEGPAAPAVPGDLGPRRLITIEILNPLEVAAKHSRAAKLLGGVTPAMISRIVYDQASTQILETLEEEGIAAEVRVHVG